MESQKDENDANSELTTKFLQGELSFTEYSEQWSGREGDDDDEAEEAPLDVGTSVPKADLPRSSFRRKRHLRVALQGLMGEANLRYARGEKDFAEKMCHEIIRQAPMSAEPYQTLAQIYENDPEKSFQFSLLAAQLQPQDFDEWLRLANLAKEKSDHKLQMLCYNRAIKANPTNLELHFMRIDLVKFAEENSMTPLANVVLKNCYYHIVKKVLASETEIILKYAKLGAALFHSDGDFEKAFTIMQMAYDKCGNHFNAEDLNLYLESMIALKKYQECLELLVEKANLEIEADVQILSEDDAIEEHTTIVKCTPSPSMPIDLKAKLLVCLIHLQSFDLIGDLHRDIMSNDVEIAGDLFLDIEEALTTQGQYDLALKTLEPLIQSKNHSLAAVWLKYAECLEHLGMVDEAITAYKNVIELAPQHTETRNKLSTLFLDKGKPEDAIGALEQNVTEDVLNPNLLYQQCQMLKSHGDMFKYIEVGSLLILRHCVPIKHKKDIASARTKDAQVKKYSKGRRSPVLPESDLPVFDETLNNLPVQNEWDLYIDVLKWAESYGLFSTMQKLTFSALGSKRFSKYREIIEYMAMYSGLLNNDCANVYFIVRDMILYKKYTGSSKIWNVFNRVAQTTEDNRLTRFIRRIFSKTGSPSSEFDILLGNNFLASGRYKYALSKYANVYNARRDPLSALLLGISLLYLACQKSYDKHHSLILQGFTFLFSYKNLRGVGSEQEIYYNLGRAYHLLSLHNLAIHYYEKSLASPEPECSHGCTVCSVQMEAAFNLHLIYKKNSPDLARMYLQKYIVI